MDGRAFQWSAWESVKIAFRPPGGDGMRDMSRHRLIQGLFDVFRV